MATNFFLLIDKNFQLAFYLALGDGIEASNDKKSSVIWNNVGSEKTYALPEKVVPVNRTSRGTGPSSASAGTG